MVLNGKQAEGSRWAKMAEKQSMAHGPKCPPKMAKEWENDILFPCFAFFRHVSGRGGHFLLPFSLISAFRPLSILCQAA